MRIIKLLMQLYDNQLVDHILLNRMIMSMKLFLPIKIFLIKMELKFLVQVEDILIMFLWIYMIFLKLKVSLSSFFCEQQMMIFSWK